MRRREGDETLKIRVDGVELEGNLAAHRLQRPDWCYSRMEAAVAAAVPATDSWRRLLGSAASVRSCLTC